MSSVSIFGGAPRTVNIVIRETFTGDGSATIFQLDGTMGNCTLNKGTWAASQIQTAYPAHVTGTDKAPTYDSTNPITRNRIGVSSINGTGLATLDYAPRSGVSFYIWYWYQLSAGDEITYYREDFVASMEEQGAALAGSISTDTTNFNGILSAADSTTQLALDTIDDHLHDGQALQCDGITSDGGAFSFSTTGAVTFNQTLSTTAGVVYVGQVDATRGTLHLYSAASTGGQVILYVESDSDDIVDSYVIKANNDDFYIGPITYANAFKMTGIGSGVGISEIVLNEDGSDVDFRVEASGYTHALFVQGSDGMVGIGASSPTATLHVLNVLNAAEVLIFKLEGKRTTPANNDTIYIDYTLNNSTSASFEYARTTITADDITATEEEGSLLFEVARAGTLEVCIKLSPTEIVINEAGADRDFRVEASSVANAFFIQGSDGQINMEGPLVTIGKADTTPGILSLYSGAATENGGIINLYLDPGDDTTVDYFKISVVDDDLLIGPDIDTDALKLDPNGNFYVTDGNLDVSGSAQIRTLLTVGVADTTQGILLLSSNGAGQPEGGTVWYTVAPDHDTYIATYIIKANEDDLEIGTETVTDLIKLVGTTTAADVSEVIINEAGNDVDFRVESTNQSSMLHVDGALDHVSLGGPILMLEQAAADADVAGYGQIWVKNDTPNTLWFTDDAGTDIRLSGDLSNTYTDNHTVLLTQTGHTLIMNSADDKTFSLPSVAAGDVGTRYYFVSIGAGKCTIDPADADTIDDSTATTGNISATSSGGVLVTLTLELVSATQWAILSGYGVWTTT